MGSAPVRQATPLPDLALRRVCVRVCVSTKGEAWSTPSGLRERRPIQPRSGRKMNATATAQHQVGSLVIVINNRAHYDAHGNVLR